MSKDRHQLTLILHDGSRHSCQVPHGANLRQVMLEEGISPYTRYTQRLNCGGKGLCATCGVWLESGEPAPVHWHDRAARRFGYPRLSCQLRVEQNMTVALVDKWIWGSRQS